MRSQSPVLTARLYNESGSGREDLEAKHGEITSLAVSRRLKLQRILQYWNTTTSADYLDTGERKQRLTFKSRGPQFISITVAD